VQQLPDYRCALFGKPECTAVCGCLRPMEEMCGANREEALAGLGKLEKQTTPAGSIYFSSSARFRA